MAAAVGLAATFLGTPIVIRAFRVFAWGGRDPRGRAAHPLREDGHADDGRHRGADRPRRELPRHPVHGGTTHPGGLALVLAAVGFGLVGFADDFTKVRRRRSLGLSKSQKFLGTAIVSVLSASL